MFIFLPQYGFSVKIGQLITLATTSVEEAERTISSSEPEYNGRVERITKSFWSTIEFLEGPDSDPQYGKMLKNRAVVTKYVEAHIFEVTKRAAMTYKANRHEFDQHRTSLRSLNTQLRIAKIDIYLVDDHINACMRRQN